MRPVILLLTELASVLTRQTERLLATLTAGHLN